MAKKGKDQVLAVGVPATGSTPMSPPPTPVSSLIATLPSAVSMHRTIDDYYNTAYEASNEKKPFSSFMDCSCRLPFYLMFVALGLANVGDAAEIGSMSFLLAHQDFRNEVVQGQDGWVASALYCGMLLGGIIAGPLCDLSGRRLVLLHGLFFNATFGVLAAFSYDPYQLILCRLAMGLGIGAVVSCLLPLTSEHTPPKHRGFYLNLVSSFWTVGSIYVAALALVMFGKLNRSWRLYMLANATPAVVSLIMVCIFVPESARFLALRGQQGRAARVANRIAKSMGFTGKELLTEDEVRAHFGSASSKSGSSSKSCMDLLQRAKRNVTSLYTNGSLYKTLATQLLWFLVSFGSGLCLWITRVFSELPFMNHIYTLTFFFSLASIPGVVLAGMIMDKVPRTTLLTTALFLTAIACGTFACLTLLTDTPWAIVLAACLFHSCLVVAWSALSVVTAEIFATSHRSTAMGVCAASGRLASVVVHLISAPLISSYDPSILLFMGSGALLLAVVISIMTTSLTNRTGMPLTDDEEQQGGRTSPPTSSSSKKRRGKTQSANLPPLTEQK